MALSYGAGNALFPLCNRGEYLGLFDGYDYLDLRVAEWNRVVRDRDSFLIAFDPLFGKKRTCWDVFLRRITASLHIWNPTLRGNPRARDPLLH